MAKFDGRLEEIKDKIKQMRDFIPEDKNKYLRLLLHDSRGPLGVFRNCYVTIRYWLEEAKKTNNPEYIDKALDSFEICEISLDKLILYMDEYEKLIKEDLMD